jgi:hypothetical protein
MADDFHRETIAQKRGGRRWPEVYEPPSLAGCFAIT